MLKNTASTLTALLLSIACYAQTDKLIVEKYIRLPGDSVKGRQLVTAINGFLTQASNPNNQNTFVLKENLPETSALLDEIKGMENGNGADKKNFYKCYLTNAAVLDSATQLVQLAYIGINKTSPILRAGFKLLVKNKGGEFYFSSPLKRNTRAWRMKAEGGFSFYYNDAVNVKKVKEYIKKAEQFDKKLNAPAYKTQIYFCNNLPYALELLGVDYKLDYNGIRQDNLSAFENNINLLLIGGNDADPAVLDLHDLWHDRLHHVISTAIINKPVDEACAYLYGGSWGISWPEIFKKFKAYIGTDNNWLTAFTDNKNFGDSQRNHLYVSYVIDALIVQQIEKEKGFDGVKQLLSCGKKETSNANFFNALDKITGINKANFNARIAELVKNEAAKY